VQVSISITCCVLASSQKWQVFLIELELVLYPSLFQERVHVKIMTETVAPSGLISVLHILLILPHLLFPQTIRSTVRGLSTAFYAPSKNNTGTPYMCIRTPCEHFTLSFIHRKPIDEIK
jgi:hypothetical protein